MYPTRIGKLNLAHFIYNAAGVWDTTNTQCQILDSSKYCGAIVTKTCTLEKRTGNEYPKYHFTNPHYSINSNGLENNGLNYYLDSIHCSKPIFISIGGMSDEERIEMITKVQKQCNYQTVGIELNMSCPNLGCPGAAYNATQLNKSLQHIFESVLPNNITFGLKLPPYYLLEDFEEITAVLKKYQDNIDFITCINSIPNGLDFDIDNNVTIIKPNGGYGGIGGPGTLPIGLANVNRFSTLFRENELDISIVGCGGVTTGEDVYKYILAGASAIQIGTHLWNRGPVVFKQVTKEFQLIMNRKGYHCLDQIKLF